MIGEFLKRVALYAVAAIVLSLLLVYYAGWLGLAALAVVFAIYVRHRLTRYLPRNRVRSMRLRLHFRLRPGRGFATVFELWLRFGRFAMWRRSQA